MDFSTASALLDATLRPYALVDPDRRAVHTTAAFRGALSLDGDSNPTLTELEDRARTAGVDLRTTELPNAFLLVEPRETVRREEVLRVALHDLRSPLASIRTLAGLMIRKPVAPARALGVGQSLARNADRGLLWVTDFLESELYALAPPRLLRAPTALGPLIDAAVVRPRELHADKGLRWTVGDLPTQPVSVDAERLARAISAVVDQAMARAPVESEVSLRATADRRTLHIEVIDAGGPPTSDDLETCRDVQVLTDRRLSPACGLAVARASLLAHGGGLDVAPVPPGVRWTLRVAFDAASDSFL